MAGYDAVKGFKSSAINEAVQPILAKPGSPEIQKLLGLVIGRSINGEAVSTSLVNSAIDNNWLTHYDQMNFLQDYRNFKEGNISWNEWVRKLAYYERLMWYEQNYNSIYRTDNSTSEELSNDIKSRGDDDLLGSGSFQDLMNNMVYRYVKAEGHDDLFEAYKQEASTKIAKSDKAYEDSKLKDYIESSGSLENGRALYGYDKYKRDTNKRVPLKIDNPLLYDSRDSMIRTVNDDLGITVNHNRGFEKQDVEKSILINTTSELTNQPLTGYLHYTENAKPALKVVNKAGGIFSMGSLANDFYQDYQVYSGRNLAKAWATNLIPPAMSATGGIYGTAQGYQLGYPYGPTTTFFSAYIGGTAGSIAGGIYGDMKKAEMRKGIPTDEELKKRNEE